MGVWRCQTAALSSNIKITPFEAADLGIATASDHVSQEDYILERLFTTLNGRPVDRDRLLKSIRSIGKRVGLKRANVHRFRHTFAINYLRNGGDPFSLQFSLGHSTMEMVKTYLALAQADLEENHLRASPVDH